MKTEPTSLTLSLVVPVLRKAGPGDGNATQAHAAAPALELFLTRAQRSAAAADLDTLLCHLFNVTLRPDADVPIAPLTYLVDHGEPPQGYCLRADPVHALADRDVLRVMEPGALPVSPAEAQELVATLNTYFAQDGLQFSAPHPGRWYLILQADPLLRTHPLAHIAGASLHDYLPFGAHGKRWHGILIEIQMLLHAHPVNNAREARGELPVNSVWFWGGGYLPIPPQKKWTQVWSDEIVTQGLARLSQVPSASAPGDARRWLNAAPAPGEHLVVLPAVTCDELAAMEAGWFGPLFDALKNRRLRHLTLHLLNETAYSIDAAVLRRWWVRRRPLTQILASLCG